MVIRRLWILTGGLGLGAMVACASVLGIDDRVPFEADGGDASTGSDSGADASGDCASRTVDDPSGIFVTLNGTDVATCGERASPCLTVQNGVAQAKLLKRKSVYIARGTYSEAIKLEPGISLEGGWDTVSASWVPICGSDALSAVKLRMPGGATATVTADFGAGEAGLRFLTVESKPAAGHGESLYGVFVRDASFTLTSVVVSMANGGDGDDGAIGDAGLPGISAAILDDAGCWGDDGGVGSPATDSKASLEGTFGQAGYVPVAGTSGSSDGGMGASGLCAAADITVCNQCQKACLHSIAGCGGAPGAGGQGGHGAGSSIAVYGWNANITVNGGAFTSGSGGSGGNGGVGGPGGPGGLGRSESVCRAESCSVSPPSCAGVCSPTIATGNAGGAGGAGGQGSGGAGGYSYAIYTGGDAGTLTLQNRPTLKHGQSGFGGQVNGGSGQSADTFP